MTIIVTRDVALRFRGFLASCMLEIAPGVYTSPGMTRGVRDRVWGVLTDWYLEIGDGSVLMTWTDSKAPGGQGILTLGTPQEEIEEYDGIFLCRRPIRAPLNLDNLTHS
ncbi:MAG: type I-E CRISPR-associated endoribonuclease Cas2e [Dehalococcoidales bacterium]|nr:type I-E CRISPR-associated endoribonuclease Cas2e [Dehalococcoidales bacterium]